MEDAESGEHVLASLSVPAKALKEAAPFALAALRLYHEGRLQGSRDGRVSAGPVDVPALLADPTMSEKVNHPCTTQHVYKHVLRELIRCLYLPIE